MTESNQHDCGSSSFISFSHGSSQTPTKRGQSSVAVNHRPGVKVSVATIIKKWKLLFPLKKKSPAGTRTSLYQEHIPRGMSCLSTNPIPHPPSHYLLQDIHLSIPTYLFACLLASSRDTAYQPVPSYIILDGRSFIQLLQYKL